MVERFVKSVIIKLKQDVIKNNKLKPKGNIRIMTEVKKQEEKVIPGEEDLKERVEGCNKELVPLLAKFELGIGAVALITADGRVGANPTMVSARNLKKEDAIPATPATKETPKVEEKKETLTNPDA